MTATAIDEKASLLSGTPPGAEVTTVPYTVIWETRYRLWIRVQHHGKAATVPFTLGVEAA